MTRREYLKSIPDLLETLMSEKRLLDASVLLVRSLKIINKPDMLEIGAVVDLRAYLVSQETVCRVVDPSQVVMQRNSHVGIRLYAKFSQMSCMFTCTSSPSCVIVGGRRIRLISEAVWVSISNDKSPNTLMSF